MFTIVAMNLVTSCLYKMKYETSGDAAYQDINAEKKSDKEILTMHCNKTNSRVSEKWLETVCLNGKWFAKQKKNNVE